MTLEELKAENVAAWDRPVQTPGYAVTVNTSCAKYIVALEERVRELEEALERCP